MNTTPKGKSGAPRSRSNFRGGKGKGAARTGPPPQAQKDLSDVARGQKERKQVVAPIVVNQNLRESLPVRADFDARALNLAYASLYSFFCNKGLMTASSEDFNDPTVVGNGLGYAFAAMVKDLKNGTIELSKAHKVILDIFAALCAKDVTFLTYARINFSWTTAVSFTNFPIIPVNSATWTPTVITSDDLTYQSPVDIPTPDFSVDNYSKFLSVTTALTTSPMLRIYSPTEYKSPLSRDVSSFARSYIFNGLVPSQSGGYYKDIENEVSITAPMLSSFATYGTVSNETRVPTKLCAFSGDAALAVGWPLHSTFVSYFNKRCPSFKIIDFEWICQFYTTWLSRAISATLASNGAWVAGETVNCTFQDFRIMLRQALMNVFDSQYMTQFTGPLEFGVNENGFVPFEVNGHCYGSQVFSTLLVPTLFRENMCALKARTIRNTAPGKSKINVITYIPILGRYVRDVPAIPQYLDSTGLAYNLFASTPQTVINLIDGSTAPGTYVNLNGAYYQNAKSNVEVAIGLLKTVMVPVTSLVGDQGPLGLGCLFYTAVCSSGEALPNLSAPKTFLMSDYTKLCKNSLPRSGEKKNVGGLPPASIISETLNFTTTGIPPNSEMQALLDTIIVPVIRVDPNGSADQLSLQMYQIEVKEPVSSKYEANPNLGGGGVFSRLCKYADLCITGIGKDETSEYDTIMRDLSAHNRAGMLSGLLGGLAKSFLPPDAHGIVDIVSDILPF